MHSYRNWSANLMELLDGDLVTARVPGGLSAASPNRLQLVQTRPKMQPCIRAYLLTSLCIISMTMSIFVEYFCTAIFVPYFARILFLYLYTGCKMKDRAIFVQVVNLAMEGSPDAKSSELLPNHWVFWFTIDDILRMVNWNHW